MTDLEQELIFGESLHWFEKVGGEGQLMAQLLLTGEQDGMIVPHLRESTLGTLHVLTIPATIGLLNFRQNKINNWDG